MNLLSKIKLQPKNLILIYFVVALLVITSALFELFQSKREMYDLMAEQAHSLLESTLLASNNALLAYDKIDVEIKNRLLNNANMIKLLYEKNMVTNKLLTSIASENNLYRINIFNINGDKIFSSHLQIHFDLKENNSPLELMKPIFNDEVDTLIIGLKQSRFKNDHRFSVAVAAKNRSAIVININAEQLLKFRNQIAFGTLLKKLTTSNKIEYAALQDTNSILAASGNINHFENYSESNFLKNSLITSSFSWRIIESDSINIFEAIHPFKYKERVIGLFRLGLSLEPVQNINSRILRRIIIISVVLFILGSLLLTYIFTQQNYLNLKKKIKIVEGYSNNVIQNVSDSVIVLDENKKIKIFNTAASKLFNRSFDSVENKFLEEILSSNDCKNILSNINTLEQFDCTINKKRKYLLVSISKFNSDNNSNTILVMRDLTDQKLLEEQYNRKERLVAMGELASGVAHEIRNPLNTISTITQQLNKDFEPINGKEEYNSLSMLVSKEIKRINETVNSFLRFAKPEKIQFKDFQLTTFFLQIENQYKAMLHSKSITLEIDCKWDGIVNWDKNQIQQIFMNLIQNSFDAIKTSGKINIICALENQENIKIIFSDNGSGISKNILNKIFNLYFTTKAKGTGIGLSLVQKIIIEHGGKISIESIENKETIFTIILPINPILFNN